MYPPVPYPPVELTADGQTPRPPKRTHNSPYKAPRPASASPAPPKRPGPSTFQPLTSRSPRPATTSLAVEVANLERRVQTLRQAIKYQRADELGGEHGECELEALCDKWKQAGLAAASALWEHASGSPADLDTSSTITPSGWASSWGFATPPSPFASFDTSNASPSWGWDVPTSGRGLTKERFVEEIDAEAARSDRTRAEVLAELDGSDRELETADDLLAGATPARRVGGSKRRRIVLDEEQDDDYAGDEVVRALDVILSTPPAATDAGEPTPDDPMSDADDEDAPSEAKWTIGALLRSVGVDPGVFGWSEDAEDFV